MRKFLLNLESISHDQINYQIFLLSAHCTNDHEAEDITLRAGSSFSSRGGVAIIVSDKLEHPQYEPSNFDFDFCILKFQKLLKFTREIAPVRLPSNSENFNVGTNCVVSGYGVTETGNVSEVLKSAEIKIIDDRRCASMFLRLRFVLTKRMLCAGEMNTSRENGNRDACSGDSVKSDGLKKAYFLIKFCLQGGPLVCNGVLYGVVSSGAQCGSKFPGIYAKVGLARNWIKQNSGV